jgi:DNA-directed RNA polymerase specialized sigma24 family protein
MRCCGIHQVADVYQNGFLENWQDIAKIRKPIIAAVSGYAVRSLQNTHFHRLTMTYHLP